MTFKKIDFEVASSNGESFDVFVTSSGGRRHKFSMRDKQVMDNFNSEDKEKQLFALQKLHYAFFMLRNYGNRPGVYYNLELIEK